VDVGAEIVSIDSAMVYRGMDIGTAKPSLQDRAAVRHHMIDVIEPSDNLTVADFQRLARLAINDVIRRNKTPLLVGGSGLYFRAVVDPLEFPPTSPQIRSKLAAECERSSARQMHAALSKVDPEAASRIEPANERRVIRAMEVIELTGRKFSDFAKGWNEYQSIYDLRVAGLKRSREDLHRLIDDRVEYQVACGLVDEVKVLEAQGYRKSLTSVQALGYAQVLAYLDAEHSMDEALTEIRRRTKRFARRQMSWFKADPRVQWFEDAPAAAGYLTGYLKGAAV